MAAGVSADYLAEVRRRRAEAERRAAAALADMDAAEAAAAARPPFVAERRHASELGVRECRREYVARYRPLVIEGMDGVTDPWPWTVEWLTNAVASKCAAVNLDGSHSAALRVDGGVQCSGVEIMDFAALGARLGASNASTRVGLRGALDGVSEGITLAASGGE